MRRRDFLIFLGGAATSPLAAHAQESGRVYRLGGLFISPRNTPWNIAFSDALKAEGYVDGQNIVIDDQGYGLRLDELADHAAAVVNAKVDVMPPLSI